jgi:hypothetical protein
MLGNCPSLDSGWTEEIQVQAKVSVTITIFWSCFWTKHCPVLTLLRFVLMLQEQHQDSGETIHEEKITKAKIDP